MTDKKIVAIGLCVLMLIILSGCGSQGNTRVTERFNPRTGYEGITLKFVENAPPDEIFEGYETPIGIEIENKGASDVSSGYLSWNIEKNLFSYEEKKENFDLIGKTPSNPQGDIKMIYNYAKANFLLPEQETAPSLIGATICYEYETVFSSGVCLDPMPLDKKNKPCEVEDISTSGQGAPVSISSIETSMIQFDEDKVVPSFTIHLQNNGKGTIINKDAIEGACSSKKAEDIFNVIYLEEAKIGADKNLECIGLQSNQQGKEYIKLRQNEDNTIKCTFQEGIRKEEGTYTAPLMIRFSYGYAETISKTIQIKSRKV